MRGREFTRPGSMSCGRVSRAYSVRRRARQAHHQEQAVHAKAAFTASRRGDGARRLDLELKREKTRDEVVGIRKRDEVASAKRVHIRIESGASDFSLEGEWEESVVGSREDTDRNARPRAKTARLLKCRAHLFARIWCVVKNGFRHVVQEVRRDVEIDGVAAAFGRVRARSGSVCIPPPLAGNLTRSGDHRVDEDQFLHGHARAHERRGKAPERLRDETAYVSSPARSSSPGRSTAMASWLARSSNGTTRCQYQAMPPAPGMRTNDAIVCARLYVGLTPASAGSPSTACRSGPRTCRSTAPTARSRSAFGLSRRHCRAPGTRDRPPPCRWRRSKCERRRH
jgi:hypothetical protein